MELPDARPDSPRGREASLMTREGPSSEAGFEQVWKRRFWTYARARDDDAGIAGWSPTGLAARFRFFQDRWSGARPGGLWLDVGCAAGTYSRFLAREGQEVVGLDYSLPSLTKAQSRSPETIRWLAADAQRLPVAAGRVDGILCFGVTQALERSGVAVGEMGRVLAPGGELWIDGLNGWCLPHLSERFLRWLQGRPPHVRYESPYYLKRVVRDTGFDQVRLLWLPILPGRLQALQPLIESRPVAGMLRWVPGLGALLSHSMVVTGKRRE